MLRTQLEHFVFAGTRTTFEERTRLRNAGFVHVTGLRAFDPAYPDQIHQYNIGQDIDDKRQQGQWGRNNGLYVIVTKGGEVWLRGYVKHPPVDETLLRDFCPNGQGAYVPLSNGETVNHYDLLRRVANPDHDLAVAGDSLRS